MIKGTFPYVSQLRAEGLAAGKAETIAEILDDGRQIAAGEKPSPPAGNPFLAGPVGEWAAQRAKAVDEAVPASSSGCAPSTAACTTSTTPSRATSGSWRWPSSRRCPTVSGTAASGTAAGHRAGGTAT